MKLAKLISTTLSAAVMLTACAAWLVLSLPATGWQALVVPTHSMQPTIPAGSLVLVHRVPVASLQIGDIITYKSPLDARKTITHRIVRTYRIAGHIPGFITKGDANKVPDIPVAGGSVSGQVVGHVPYAGTVLAWIHTWPGTILLVYIPALLIIIAEVRRLTNYYRRLIVYRLFGYAQQPLRSTKGFPLAASLAAVAALVASASVWSPVVQAWAHSNTAALVHNQFKLSPGHQPHGGRDHDQDGDGHGEDTSGAYDE